MGRGSRTSTNATAVAADAPFLRSRAHGLAGAPTVQRTGADPQLAFDLHPDQQLAFELPVEDVDASEQPTRELPVIDASDQPTREMPVIEQPTAEMPLVADPRVRASWGTHGAPRPAVKGARSPGKRNGPASILGGRGMGAGVGRGGARRRASARFSPGGGAPAAAAGGRGSDGLVGEWLESLGLDQTGAGNGSGGIVEDWLDTLGLSARGA